MDDLTIPDETKIYYSRTNSVITLIIMIGLLITGVAFIISTQSLLGVIITIFSCCATFLTCKKLNNNRSKIILNEKGIATTTEFNNWSEVRNESIIKQYWGSAIYYYCLI
jgi:hypothetical protein